MKWHGIAAATALATLWAASARAQTRVESGDMVAVPPELDVTAKLYNTGASAASGAAPVTVYLERHGATLRAGFDDSDANTSSLPYTRGLASLEVPAFEHGERSFAQVADCVGEELAPFLIDVVIDRPASGDYIMVMLGGTPDLLGYGDGVSGVSPYSGEVIADAVVYVFTRAIGDRPRAICETALHEIGHAVGLDHAYHCEDPMSYLHGCGDKHFADVDAACGEYDPRACAGGDETQNSYRHLAAAVGLREIAIEPEPEPEWEPEPEPEPDEWTSEEWTPETVDPYDDRAAPELVVAPAETVLGEDGYHYVHIVLYAADDAGIEDVELGWATPEEAYVLSCAAMPEDLPAACYRDGDFWAFALRVGRGERAFAVRAVDAAGNETISEVQTLEI